MSKTKEAEKHPKEQLWKELKHSRAGMLGVEGSHSHMQPMSPMVDEAAGRIWFFTSRGSDLVKDIGNGARAHFCVIGKHQDYHACLAGELRQSADTAKVQELWNDWAAAWWSGPSDPDLALLEFDLDDAAVWASTKNPVKIAWEIERAKHSSKEPDIGTRTHVDFN